MLKCVICQKETTEKPHCPVNWKRYNSGAGYLYTFERDLKLNYEAGKVNLAIAWKCFYISKSFATVWHRLSRCVQQDCTGSHDEKKNDFRNPSMFLFERSLSGLKMIVHLPDAGENGHKSVMIRTFTLFFLAPFSSISWILQQAYLDLKEFWVSYGTALCKGPWSPCPPCPNSVRHNFLLSWSWNFQNTRHGFCHFFFSH